MGTIQCPACGGMGYKMVQKLEKGPDGKMRTVTVDQRCSGCNGSGSVQGH